jgi:biopolymer transport protein ExbD
MKLLNYLLIFNVLTLSAQVESIELPDLGENKVSSFSWYNTIYVTKTGVVLFDNDTIPIPKIAEKLFVNKKQDRTMEAKVVYGPKAVHIFADKNLNYSLIDGIKTELSKTNRAKRLIYRSNFTDNGHEMLGLKHDSPPSFFSIQIPEYRKTRKAQMKEDSIRKIELEKFPDIGDMNDMLDQAKGNWIPVNTVETSVYGIQQDIIDEALANKSYKCYSISNNGLEDYNRVYKDAELETVLEESDIVFLDYKDDLTYGNYLKFILELHKFIPNSGNKKVKTTVIELSNQIKTIHKMAEIKLCN